MFIELVPVRRVERKGARTAACAVALACALGALTWIGAGAWSPERAEARGMLLPPQGKMFHGISDTGHFNGYRRFTRQVGVNSAVLQSFLHWGAPIYRAIDRWEASRSRGAISISTDRTVTGPEIITPRQIRRGHGDDWLVYLNRAFHRREQPVYVRLFAEMNGHWNSYSAYNADGGHRGAQHSHGHFRKAWQRAAVILAGGRSVPQMNRTLRRLGLPPLLRGTSHSDPVYREHRVHNGIPRARISMMWMPQTVGSPNVPGNHYRHYWPGDRFVDWIGFDTYARFYRPWTFREADRLMRFKPGYPFAIGEYSPWSGDPRGQFTRKLFAYARNRGRVRMAWYYQDFAVGGPHEIQHYPRARRILRQALRTNRWMAIPPEWRGRRPPPPPPPPGQGSGGVGS